MQANCLVCDGPIYGDYDHENQGATIGLPTTAVLPI